MPMYTDHRQAVTAALRLQKHSRYWLHKQLATEITAPHLYAYLKGQTGVSVENLHKINDALGITFHVPDRETTA